MIDQIQPYNEQNNKTTSELRDNFKKLYDRLDNLEQKVYIGYYEDWNTTTEKRENKSLIAAPMSLVTQDPLSGGTGKRIQTFYIGVSFQKVEFNPPIF